MPLQTPVASLLDMDDTSAGQRAGLAGIGPFEIFDYIIIIGLSLFLGIGLNGTNPHGIQLIPKLSFPETLSSASIPYAIEKYRKGDAIFIDAMPSQFYDKEHIKGALNLPSSLFDIMYMLNFSSIEKDCLRYIRPPCL